MNYRKKHYSNINLEGILTARMKLQSTQRDLNNNLNIQGLHDLAQLKTYKFIDFYQNMNDVSRKSFLITVFGATNYHKSINFMNEIIEQLRVKTANLVTK